MTPAQTRLARQRLALGIVNVGFWVLSASAGLLWLLFHGTYGATLFGNGLVLAGAVLVQAGFDYVGGARLMPTPAPTPGQFLRAWVPGALGHTLVLATVAGLHYASFRAGAGFLPAIVLATGGLALGRRWLLWAVGGVSTFEAPASDGGGGENVLVAAAGDPAFTGGIIGWGRGKRSLLPTAWAKTLLSDEFAAEVSRRRWQMAGGWPDRTVLLVLGWNLLGAALGAFVLRLNGRPPAGALLLQGCWMTLWAFGGLLILPSLSRGAVFAADRAALEAGHDPRGWIARFPALVGEDGGTNPLVQNIFYPVPSAQRRLQRLAGPTPRVVFGSLARGNLYYSWATCTLLGRAVHCNVGRPALWVFPPSA